MKQNILRLIFPALLGAGAFILATRFAPPPGPAVSVARAAQDTRSDAEPLAPEFPAEAAWLNTDKPLSLRALRGKVVLLDFWTYGCINCMHILPDLKRLERKYPNELVVISVHSAKFANEDETANIRNALLRYNIEHPVLNDADMKVWNAYGVNSWPTFVLIDPGGHVVGATSGEGNYDVLDRAVGDLVKRYGANGNLSRTPLRFTLEAAKIPDTPLWYPGKVLADPAGDHLFIADTNHHRIVIADRSGNVQAVAGTGVAGKRDGAFDVATFHSPQGMALHRDADGGMTLLVADTNNHALRALDLKRGTVTTIAGTGKQAAWGSGGGLGTSAALSSPWDLLLAPGGDNLFIAMAGPHQIWSMNLRSKRVGPYAGSGREARTDGTLESAAFAQPSGLASDGTRLFVADSEVSAVRAVDLPATGRAVRTLAGGDLFDFGDRDGTGTSVRLQHPLGVAWNAEANLLYVADTYNHKIKTLDPATGRVQSWLGGGRGADALFYEPGGISLANGKLYVADTNNHRIRVVDIATKAVSTLALKNLPAALAYEPERSVRPTAKGGEDGTITLPLATVAPDATGALVLDVALPPGHHLNPGSSQRLQARVEGLGLTLARNTVPSEEFTLPLRVPFTSGKAGTSGAAVVSASLFYCSDDARVCKLKSLRFRAPFEVRAGGANDLTLKAELK